MKATTKKVLLELGGFTTSIAPLGITLITNWDKYAPTEYEGIKLGFGATLVIVFTLLKALNKVNAPKGVWLFAGIFALSWCFKSVVDDIVLLSGMALLGELADAGFKLAVKKNEVTITKEKEEEQAQLNAEALGNVLTKMNGQS